MTLTVEDFLDALQGLGERPLSSPLPSPPLRPPAPLSERPFLTQGPPVKSKANSESLAAVSQENIRLQQRINDLLKVISDLIHAHTLHHQEFEQLVVENTGRSR